MVRNYKHSIKVRAFPVFAKHLLGKPALQWSKKEQVLLVMLEHKPDQPVAHAADTVVEDDVHAWQ